MTTCKNCGAELSDKDCFCPVCGNAISSEITVEEPTQVFDISKDDIENVNEDMPEKSQVNAFIPNWDQAFACVPVDGDIPPREYFCAWDWIPENERSPQIVALADAYPLKKNRRWANRVVLWILVLFFCAVVFTGVSWTVARGSQIVQRTIDRIIERIPDSYTVELPNLFEEETDQNPDIEDYIDDFFDWYYGNESEYYRDFFEQYFNQ